MAQGLLKSNLTRDGIAAVLAYNISDLEENVYNVQQEWESQHSQFNEMQAAMEQAGLRVLNGPNLLKQPTFTTRAYPSSPVIDYDITIPAETAEEAAVNLTYTVTNAAITSAYVLTGVTSRIYAIAGPGDMTCVASAGSAVITVGPRNEGAAHEALTVTAHLCTVANQTVPYGTTSRSYASGQPYLDSINDGSYPGHNNDEISESVVTLTGDDIITEPDGEVYNTAIAFTVTNPPAQGWGNADRLIWNYGTASSTIEMVNGAPKYRRYGEVDLIVGETYTLCCWARITDGSKAALWMGLPEYYKMTDAYAIKEIEAGGGKWQRVVFQFTFNPTGDQFYTYTYDDKTYQACNWTKRVIIGVCRKYAGTVQLCGFRLVRGKLWISETYDDLDEGLTETKDRVTALETGAETTKNSILSIFAESDTATATANHAVGDLFVMGGKLYKATAAIATGETIEVGTNCEVKTIEEYFAPKQNPNFTDSVSMGRRDIDYIGPSSTGLGNVVIASGYYSQAMGNWTTAQRKSQFVFGEFNDPDQSGTYGTRGNYVEIVGNGSMSKRSNARTLDWNGNEVLAGKLTVGAGPSADMDAATKKYVDDENAGKILIDLPNVNMGIGMFQTYTPFEAQKYRITKITIDNRYAISNLKAKTGKDNASRSFILIQATVDQAAIYTNPYRHITLELERIHKSYNADWSENELNGFETALD